MIANKLKKGDIVGIVAPSGYFKESNKENLILGVNILNKLGFQVRFGENMYKINKYSYCAGTCEERAEDINSMFADESVKAIISLKGGDNANGVLPLLNYELIKNNPKIFMGISDITVILNAIYKKTTLITYHTNDFLYGFGGEFSNYDKQEFEKALVIGDRNEIGFNSERKIIRAGIGEGILLGGNIRCLLKLAGTEYFPDFNNAILFVEAMSGDIKQYDYMFEQLKQIGVMDKINGAIIGYVKGLQGESMAAVQMEDIFLDITRKYNFPILKCNDFGHKNSNTVMPIGVKVKIDTNDCSIKICSKEIK